MCNWLKSGEIIACWRWLCPNVSTTPLRQWGFRQCLPFSWTTLRGKHCWHSIAVMGVVDTFGQYQFLTIKMYFMNYDMYHVLNWHKHLQIKSKAIQMKILNKKMDLFTNYSQLGKKSPSFEFQSEMSNIIILAVKKCAPRVRSC